MSITAPVICTIANTAYLPQVRCLKDSFLKHHPEGKVFLLLVDKPEIGLEIILQKEGFTTIELEALGEPEINSMVVRYNLFELCNALKPFLLEYLLKTYDYEKLCYFDGDIYIYDSLNQEVWDKLDEFAIVLTPHEHELPKNSLLTGQKLYWLELAIRQRGIYNGGFMGVSRHPDAQKFLHWWKSRLVNFGYYKLEEGMNCDQAWLDFVPSFGLNVCINRHPGLNVGFWNLHQRYIEHENGRYKVNGMPLNFFHFSGYSTERPDLITKHNTDFTFENRPDLKSLFEHYHHHLKAANFKNKIQHKLKETENQLEPSIKIVQEFTSANSPRVSVVMPVYNGAHFIQEALESVFKQTYKNCEIIVIDDGSKDDTRSVLEPFFNRIRYIYQNNQGVSSARNRGIQEARGEFIAFLDADDFFFLPTKLEEQVACFDRDSSLGIVHSGWRKVNSAGEKIADVEMWKKAPNLDLETWLMWQPVLPSAMMFRREWLQRVGGFNTRFSHSEDVDLVLRLTSIGCQSYWLKKVTVAYRQHETSASIQSEKKALLINEILENFFASPHLPPSVTQLEKQVRYSTLVWQAWNLYDTGNFVLMAEFLKKSLQYSSSSTTETMASWMNAFNNFYEERGIYNINTASLCNLPEWQQLVRSLVVKTPPQLRAMMAVRAENYQ